MVTTANIVSLLVPLASLSLGFYVGTKFKGEVEACKYAKLILVSLLFLLVVNLINTRAIFNETNLTLFSLICLVLGFAIHKKLKIDKHHKPTLRR